VALNPAGWLRENARTYFGNAAAVRDYRAQLRGNRALWLWGGYLGLLVLITSVIYSSTVRGNVQDIALVQFQLREFYGSIITMLAVFVTLVTPAMTASAITIERQRKSLDLVFTAPVSPKYLLIGKMLSSYRYTWMLLVLALPITAVSVVMGGATWMDVLAAFIMLSAHALIFTSIGILLSTLSPNTVAAVVYTYLVVGLYSGVMSGIAAAYSISSFSGMGTGEVSWAATLTPFSVGFVAPTFTTLWGIAVPNWVFTVLFALTISKVLLVASASALTHFLSADTKSLRVHALVYAFLASTLMVGGTSGVTRAAAGSMTGRDADFARAFPVVMLSLILLFFVPHLTCYSSGEGVKFRPTGAFSFKEAIRGRTSGAGPFLLLFAALAFGGGALGSYFGANVVPGFFYWGAMIYILGMFTFWWAAGRLISSFGPTLKTARLLLVAVMVFLLGAPVPLLSIYEAATMNYGGPSDAWRVLMLYPLGGPGAMETAAVYGTIFLVLGVLLAAYAESNLRNRISR